MSLSRTKLGPYEILPLIGAGGMGEVYRARDIKLKREVALRVLPEAFASDPERVARFQREAEVLASLNYTNNRVTVPLNFFAYLRRRVPTGGK